MNELRTMKNELIVEVESNNVYKASIRDQIFVTGSPTVYYQYDSINETYTYMQTKMRLFVVKNIIANFILLIIGFTMFVKFGNFDIKVTDAILIIISISFVSFGLYYLIAHSFKSMIKKRFYKQYQLNYEETEDNKVS